MMIAFIGVLGAICLGATAIIQKLWALIFYATYYFLMAVCNILTEEFIQKEIEEEGRSTVHSIISFIMNLFGMISFLILGAIFEWRSLFSGILITSILMIVVITLFCYFLRGVIKE